MTRARKRRIVRQSRALIEDYGIPFVYGVAWDAILTADVIVTATYKILWAMVTSAIITYISFSMYDRVFKNRTINRRRLYALIAGSGCGAGLMTYLLM